LALDLYNIFWLIGFLAELLLVIVATHRKLYHDFPVFYGYLGWSLAVDLLLYLLRSNAPSHYFGPYFAETALDSLFRLFVLVELAWSVLRPIRRSLPRSTPALLAVLFLFIATLAWPLADFAIDRTYWTTIGSLYIQMQQTAALLLILSFLFLAAVSQMLSLNWRNRELQIASGFGFYSLVSFGVSAIHAHQFWGNSYRLLDQVGMASYVVALIYWCLSFSQQTAERRAFTPGMEKVLVTLASNAEASRLALTGRKVPPPSR